MRIIKGTSRSVLVLGNFVIKFPRIIWFLKKSLWSYYKGYYRNIGYGYQYILIGMYANITEYLTYVNRKSEYLVPVYFSCALFNIQKFERGDKPSYELLNKIWKLLPEKAYLELRCMDAHAFEPKNFVLNSTGLHFIDYADPYSDNSLLSTFLRRWDKELKEQFKKTPML